MSELPIVHDEMCYEQSRQLTLQAEQMKNATAMLSHIAERAQLLVEQYHAQNIAQATMLLDILHIRGKVDDIEKSLEKDYALRSEFVEIKNEWRKFLGTVLVGVVLAAVGFMIRGGLFK